MTEGCKIEIEIASNGYVVRLAGNDCSGAGYVNRIKYYQQWKDVDKVLNDFIEFNDCQEVINWVNKERIGG